MKVSITATGDPPVWEIEVRPAGVRVRLPAGAPAFAVGLAAVAFAKGDTLTAEAILCLRTEDDVLEMMRSMVAWADALDARLTSPGVGS